jgi:tetratricopeptide (TPR) repeat protein
MFVAGDFKQRIAGKWQIPLLVLALAALGGAILRSRPTPPRTPVERAAAYIDALLAGGMNDKALEFARAALATETRPASEWPPLHLRLARAISAEARERNRITSDVGAEIIAHYQLAQGGGQTLTPEDFERTGLAYEWQSDFPRAIENFQRAVATGIPAADDIKKHIVEIELDRIGVATEVARERLDAYLASVEPDRTDLISWALEREVYLLQDAGDTEGAATVIARYRDSLTASEFADRADYLWALVSHPKDPDGAERLLRAVLSRVEPQREEHAMAGWLLGRIILAGDGPQRPVEAMSFFAEVIDHHPGSAYALASEVGRAEALSLLERHDDSVATFDRVIESMEGRRDARVVSRDSLRGTLMGLAGASRAARRYREGAAYAQRASAIVDISRVEESSDIWQALADLLALRARELMAATDAVDPSDHEQARSLRADASEHAGRAARVYMDLARINTLNDSRWALASRDAAEMYELAGSFDRARALYRDYARERPRDPFAPRALYRIGVIHRAMGDPSAAAAAFQECLSAYPNSMDAAKALLPLADCYLAGGPDQIEQAERTLRRITDDPVLFTPEAPEFEEALLRLGEVQNRRGAFEDAVTTLEDWSARYGQRPGDPSRLPQLTYLLADSYRQSGVALKRELADPRFKGQMDEMLAAVKDRLDRARDLYRELVDEYRRRDPTTLTARERMYLRHGRLYEADCLFELVAYKPALKLYEEAVGAYQDTTSALAAYVQIINCHVFLGQKMEARAALARAEILVDRIPDEAFTAPLSLETRSDWKRYLQWLRDSEFLGKQG